MSKKDNKKNDGKIENLKFECKGLKVVDDSCCITLSIFGEDLVLTNGIHKFTFNKEETLFNEDKDKFEFSGFVSQVKDGKKFSLVVFVSGSVLNKDILYSLSLNSGFYLISIE